MQRFLIRFVKGKSGYWEKAQKSLKTDMSIAAMFIKIQITIALNCKIKL